jgi:hypothetical protein
MGTAATSGIAENGLWSLLIDPQSKLCSWSVNPVDGNEFVLRGGTENFSDGGN